MAEVVIREMLAGDLVQLALQPSQHVTLGISKPVHSLEDGEEMVAAGPAWSAIAGGRVLCCYGFAMVWPAGPGTGGHALAWALLAEDVGAAHLAITRFARATIAESPITRIEAIVRADVDAEVNWARMVGLNQVAELRAWGPDGKTHLLFERIREGER